MGTNTKFSAAADSLGALLARNAIRLVYGAGDVGLMGAVANATLQAGGLATGVITEHLVALEVGKPDLTKYIVVETMHQRKKMMFDEADAVIALPGGPGTLDEFFEVLTWRQLNMHDKPIVLLNIDGYWQPLISLIDHTIANGFASSNLTSLFHVAGNPEQAIQIIQDQWAVVSETR